jgi:predicted O-methyltransferase YrrM
MSDYQFTKDWFNWAPEVWSQLIPMLSGEAGKRNFLEIGSFEGRSSVWIAENMMQDGDHLSV